MENLLYVVVSFVVLTGFGIKEFRAYMQSELYKENIELKRKLKLMDDALQANYKRLRHEREVRQGCVVLTQENYRKIVQKG